MPITSKRVEGQSLFTSGNAAGATAIPEGFRRNGRPHRDGADESLADSTTVVAESSSGSPAHAEVAQPGGHAGEDLATSFARQYQTVLQIDEAVGRFEIKRRRTPEYVKLGGYGVELKEALGHGKWLPFLAEHAYAERTVQRGMRIYALFHDHVQDCMELTLEEAEQFGKKAEAEPKPKSKGGKRSEQQEKQLDEVLDDKEAHDDEAEDEAHEEKNELLWGILSEATAPGFDITDAEREAFDTFIASVGNEDRAVRVMLSRIWNMI